MSKLILFDDGQVGGGPLSPLTDLRASFELRSGAVTTGERLARRLGRELAGVVVAAELAGVVATRFDVPVNRLPEGDGFLVVNGRWVRMAGRLPDELNTAMVDAEGAVVAAYMDAAQARRFIEGGCELPDDVDATPVRDAGLLSRPWELPSIGVGENLIEDLEAMAHVPEFDAGTAVQAAVTGEHPVRVSGTAEVGAFVVFDTSEGAIVIDESAVIQPHCVIGGPCYVGTGSVIRAHADVRHSVIGPQCRVGGEVSGSVIQGYSNKAHYGYLGDSYIGEWVNLGAGTTTSNLKNTYGPVRMQTHMHGRPEPTGQRFLGSVVGDHVKTAIGTRLMTGACVHTGAMIAVSGFAPKCVERFAFLTDDGAGRFELEHFALVADRMMQRRAKRVTAELTQRFAELHTEHRRPTFAA
jgi:UDP-N-acetylglucosamine diphosphorylase/glucosamine-1-phosphate N-acetyltransferase